MSNPLAKHFRQPALYLRLPSGGRFWPEGSIELTATGEVPVFPMTIRDEIVLKTPDALMNGEGVANMIRSCIPSIKDPYICPNVDLDAILIAIRLASYGQGMDIETVCPSCKEKNENTVDLTNLLDNIRMVGYDNKTINGLTFEFRPQTFRDLNTVNLAAFEEQKLLGLVADDSIDDITKNNLFKSSFEKLTELNLSTVLNSIEAIVTNGERVIDRKQIKEFFDNCDRQTYDTIKVTLDEYNQANKLKPLNLKCSSCEHDYESDITFDQSNFFV